MEKIKRINENEVKVDGCVYRKVEEPKPEFKVGDWVTGSMASWSSPVRIEKVLEKNNYIVTNVFDDPKNYSESIRTYEVKYLRHATKDEIESHLKKICDERYVGKKVKCLMYPNDSGTIFKFSRYDGVEMGGDVDQMVYIDTDDRCMVVYSEGKFAEIIPDKKKLPKTKDEFENFLDAYNPFEDSIKEFLNDYE